MKKEDEDPRQLVTFRLPREQVELLDLAQQLLDRENRQSTANFLLKDALRRLFSDPQLAERAAEHGYDAATVAGILQGKKPARGPSR